MRGPLNKPRAFQLRSITSGHLSHSLPEKSVSLGVPVLKLILSHTKAKTVKTEGTP
jgi:hypothetical protein